MATVPDLSGNTPLDVTLIDSTTDTDISKYLPNISTELVDSNGNVLNAHSTNGRLLQNLTSNAVGRAARQIVRPTNLHTYTLPRTGADTAIASGTTIAALWTLDLDFDYIRLVIGQQSADAVTAIACVAPTATANDGVNPLDESSSAVTFTRVLFNNAGSANYTPFNQNTGATDSITLTTSSETQVWGLTYSDWMQISSLPQIGGSAYPLLMTRVYLTGAPVAVPVSSANIYGLTPVNTTFGRTWAAYSDAADRVTTTAGYASSGTSYGTHWAPLMIQAYSRKLGYQLFGCGDSNVAGTGSTLGMLSFVRRAALALNNKYPVIYSNFNQPGSTAEIYMRNVVRIVDAVKPSAVVMFPFTYNSAATMATANANYARAMEIVNKVQSYGGTTVLVGYPPRTGATTGEDTVRRTILARIASANAVGLRGVDPNVYISDSASPANWLTGMTDDGIHLSNLAHGIASDLVVEQLAAAFGIG